MPVTTRDNASKLLRDLKNQDLAYLKRFNQQQRRDIDTLISGMSKQVLMEFEISSSLTLHGSLSPPNPAGSDLLTRIWKGFLNMIGWRISSASLFDKIQKLEASVLSGSLESRPVDEHPALGDGPAAPVDWEVSWAAPPLVVGGVVIPPDQVSLRLLELDAKYWRIGFYARYLLSSPELMDGLAIDENDYDENWGNLRTFEGYLQGPHCPDFGLGLGSCVRALLHEKYVLDLVQRPGFLELLCFEHKNKRLYKIAGGPNVFQRLLVGLALNNPSYIAAVAPNQNSEKVWAIQIDYLENLDRALGSIESFLGSFCMQYEDSYTTVKDTQVYVLRKIQSLSSSKLLDLLDEVMRGFDVSLRSKLFRADGLNENESEMVKKMEASVKALKQFKNNFTEHLDFILSSHRISFALDALSLAHVSYMKTREDFDLNPNAQAYVAAYEPFFAVAKEEEPHQIDQRIRTLIHIRLVQVFRFILGAPELGITPPRLDQKIDELG